MRYFIFLMMISSFAKPAWAGWASGGGLIHRDSNNPWFLENTKLVRYCVDVDEEHFGVAQDEAETLVTEALNDWITGFRLGSDSYYEEENKDEQLVPYGQIRLATQSFEKHACSEPVSFDLRFQLGRLLPEQRKAFKNPRDFVGIAIRSDYDKEILKGRGFIYLTPTSGPLKANHGQMQPEVWRQDDYFSLKIVLRHEIGHIFGLDHQPQTIMDDQLPEFIVDRQFLGQLTDISKKNLAQKFTPSRLFGRQEEWSVAGCGAFNPILNVSVFQLNLNYEQNVCGKVDLRYQKQMQGRFTSGQITISYGDDESHMDKIIATASLHSVHNTITPAVAVFLPDEQKVFSKVPAEAKRMGHLYGEEKITSRQWQGELQIKATGEVLPLLIDINDDGSSATVIKNNRFERYIFSLDQ